MVAEFVRKTFIFLWCLWGILFCQETPMPSRQLEAGVAAPTFSLPTLTGEREALRVWCGQNLLKPGTNMVRHMVILSFWATYCLPCLEEIPQLQAFSDRHKNDKVKTFLISIDEKGAEIVAPFAQEKKVFLPVLLDPYKKITERYGVKSLPALFVIDTMGTICYSSVGFSKEISVSDILEKVFLAQKEGKPIPANLKKDKIGESVVIRSDTTVKDTTQKTKDASLMKKSASLTSKQRWEAIARIECGVSPDTVAAQFQVSVEELKKWYQDLKNAAIRLWEKK